MIKAIQDSDESQCFQLMIFGQHDWPHTPKKKNMNVLVLGLKGLVSIDCTHSFPMESSNPLTEGIGFLCARVTEEPPQAWAAPTAGLFPSLAHFIVYDKVSANREVGA